MKVKASKERIEWIDLSKGIAILLVVLAHTVGVGIKGNIIRGAIYSFHMPLFFILSAATYTLSRDKAEFKQKTIRAAKHLLIPLLIVIVLRTIYAIYQNNALLTKASYWKELCYSIIYSNGVKHTFGEMNVPELGLPWFFVALFLGRTIFDYLHLYSSSDERFFLVCAAGSVLGVLLGGVQWLPFALDIALACLLLFYFGNSLKEKEKMLITNKKTLLFFVIWLIGFILQYPNVATRTYLDMAWRRYPLFPICFITAIAGTLTIAGLSKVLLKWKKAIYPVVYIGKNSMVFFVVHCMDRIWKQLWVHDNQYISALLRIGTNLIVFFLVITVIHGYRRWRECRISHELM